MTFCISIKNIHIISTLLLLSLMFFEYVQSQCCLKFNGNQCVSCPDNMHIYRGNCIYNLPNCKAYANGFDCSQCIQGFQVNNNQCNSITHVQFDDIIISIPLNHSSLDDRISRACVAQDIFQSTYQSIRHGTVVKAFDRVYKNGTKNVHLHIKGKYSNDVYEGVMNADLDTFIFRQISFKKLEDKPIVVDITKKSQNRQSKNDIKNNQSNLNKNNSLSNNNSASTNKNSSTINSTKIDNKTTTSGNNTNNLTNSSSLSQKTNSTNFLTVNNASSSSTSTSSTNNQTKSMSPSSNGNLSSQSPKKQEYSYNKFTQLSDIDALMDINYVICLNQINNQVKQIDGLEPYKNLKENKDITNNQKNTDNFQRYIITFKVDKTQQFQVCVKIQLQSHAVTIDKVMKKAISQSPTNTLSSGNGSTASDSNQIDFSKVTKDKLIQQSSDPSQADLTFLIFLDNVRKAIQKDFQAIGEKANQKQIIYAGKMQVKDFIYFWVQTLVDCQSKNKKIVTIKGQEHKTTYEVKILDIFISDIKQINNSSSNTNNSNKTIINQLNSSTVSNTSTVSNSSTAASNSSQSNLIKNNSTPVTSNLSNQTQAQVVTSNSSNISKTGNSTISSNATNSGNNSSNFINSTVSPNFNNVSNSSSINSNSTPNKSVSTQQNSSTTQSQNQSSSQQQLPTNIHSKEAPIVNIQLKQTKQILVSNSTIIKGINGTISNTPAINSSVPINTQNYTNNPPVTSQNKTNNSSNITSQPVIQPITQPITQQKSTSSQNLSNSISNKSITTFEPDNLYLSEIYGEINQTIKQKASGFEEIGSSIFNKDDAINSVSTTMLISRAGRQSKKLYKVYIKNMGIKAEYKLYYIDTTSNPGYIQVFEGYATFDMLRKRVFVMAFGAIN